ncbi:MAG: alpha/beta hydrolase fold domain-containing protein, partial [Myxococcales bacterium]|nr:alpha/beta hydrolase fold domain-containing protein [Myxococcales bacterium]
GFDPLRDDAEAYATRLEAAGVPVTYQLEPGLIHGFLQLGNVIDAARAANDRIGRALWRGLHGN